MSFDENFVGLSHDCVDCYSDVSVNELGMLVRNGLAFMDTSDADLGYRNVFYFKLAPGCLDGYGFVLNVLWTMDPSHDSSATGTCVVGELDAYLGHFSVDPLGDVVEHVVL